MILDDITWSDLDIIKNWCFLTMGGAPDWKWYYTQTNFKSYRFTFVHEEDATAFKLRFSDLICRAEDL